MFQCVLYLTYIISFHGFIPLSYSIVSFHVFIPLFHSVVSVWFDPADHFKAGKPFQTSAWKHITYTAPNMKELRKMHVAVKGAREELVNGK